MDSRSQDSAYPAHHKARRRRSDRGDEGAGEHRAAEADSEGATGRGHGALSSARSAESSRVARGGIYARDVDVRTV